MPVQESVLENKGSPKGLTLREEPLFLAIARNKQVSPWKEGSFLA